MGRFEFGYYGFGGYVRYRFGWADISLIGILLRQLGRFCYGLVCFLQVTGSFAVEGEILDEIITSSRGEFPDEVYSPQPFELLIAMEQLHCNVQQRWDQGRNHTDGLLLFQLQKNSAMLTVLLLLSKCRQRNVPVIEPGSPDIVNFITQSAVVQGTKGCRGRGWFDSIAARPLSDLGLPFWVC
ncbi:hypothetical protein KIW84_022068 [Lathyrus oleraceus]|uniref:Uncharacterized protein n=1 Tax=Pisum sativum TaxID=3888 RepID=A0A9D5BA96_PEA|nr:hypothetical protein KIW84_022068 [Pisum sativum]